MSLFLAPRIPKKVKSFRLDVSGVGMHQFFEIGDVVRDEYDVHWIVKEVSPEKLILSTPVTPWEYFKFWLRKGRKL